MIAGNAVASETRITLPWRDPGSVRASPDTQTSRGCSRQRVFGRHWQPGLAANALDARQHIIRAAVVDPREEIEHVDLQHAGDPVKISKVERGDAAEPERHPWARHLKLASEPRAADTAPGHHGSDFLSDLEAQVTVLDFRVRSHRPNGHIRNVKFQALL